MKKNILLMLAATTLTLLVALGLIRKLAPGLLGGPTDLQLVQLDEKLPAFYEGVFRQEHLRPKELQLKDPLTRIRNYPLLPRIAGPGGEDSLLPRMAGLGPHDVLGFRNREVPVVADVVVIGDSNSYGNNAVMEQSWPAVAGRALRGGETTVYNMSTGGWAAVQYLDMFAKAVMFRPYVVVVAFYTGNDPLESYTMVYGNENWDWLKPDETLSRSDSPKVEFPAPESERWAVTFQDGTSTEFTPTLRLASNQDHVAVNAGYQIMANVAGYMGALAGKAGFPVVFTIIPTKELAFALKVEQEGLDVPADYTALISRERANIDLLAERIRAAPGAVYIDVLTALQEAVLGPDKLYTASMDGHPAAGGYRVIGETVSEKINELLPEVPGGLYARMDGNTYNIVLVNDEGAWYFDSEQMVEKNGWPPGELRTISERDLVNIPHRGTITSVDESRFGPACCNTR
jgi:hypothetical protein